MTPRPAWLVAGAALAALFLFRRDATAQDLTPEQIDQPQDAMIPDPTPPTYPTPAPDPQAQPDNVRAFLRLLRYAEHSQADADSGACYGTFYGGARFTNFADHPVITGELQPVKLPDRFAAPLGLTPPIYSSAAGAYQITRGTWLDVRKAGPWGPYLPDFSPASQDEAARRLLMRWGILGSLDAGDFSGALAKASRVWASLPGSTAGQGGRSLEWAVATYQDGMQGVA